MPPPPPPPPVDPFMPTEKPPLAPPGVKPPTLQEKLSLTQKDDSADTTNVVPTEKATRRRKKLDKRLLTPETIARRRTSESAMRLVAGLAIQFAIRSKRPEHQSEQVRQAEHGYISHLWNSYTKRALRLGN